MHIVKVSMAKADIQASGKFYLVMQCKGKIAFLPKN